MKKLIFILLSFTYFSACQKENPSDGKDRFAVTAQQAASTAIVSESGIDDYFLNPAGRTWKDVDAFYQQTVEKYKDNPYLFNFKAAGIHCLVDVYKISEDSTPESLPRVAFYAEELAHLRNCHPATLFSLLDKLQKTGFWDEAKVKTAATTGYENGLHFFKLMPSGTPQYEKHKKGLEDLETLVPRD